MRETSRVKGTNWTWEGGVAGRQVMIEDTEVAALRRALSRLEAGSPERPVTRESSPSDWAWQEVLYPDGEREWTVYLKNDPNLSGWMGAAWLAWRVEGLAARTGCRGEERRTWLREVKRLRCRERARIGVLRHEGNYAALPPAVRQAEVARSVRAVQRLESLLRTATF
jgi:hypothetical protein